jgi:hypothetical protein
MVTDWFTQPIIERRSVRNGQSVATVPLSYTLSAFFRYAGFACYSASPLPHD